MTEQQEHLSNLLNQRQSLSQEIININTQVNEKRELLFKVQGVIEYLTQIGVTLPEPDPAEESEEPEA
jgi:hypothetical protein